MTTKQMQSAFLDLRLSNIRLVSESANATVPSTQSETKKAEVKTETSISFTVGLDSLDNPSALLIQVDYKVNLFVDGTTEQLVSYAAMHEAAFDISGSSDGINWEELQNNQFDPYFTMLHQNAIQRVEQTLLAMGFRGIPIPLLKSFG